MDPKDAWKHLYIIMAFWTLLMLADAFLVFGRPQRISYTEFKAEVAGGRVTEVAVSKKLLRGEIRPGAGEKARPFEALRVDDPELLRDLQAHGVKVTGAENTSLVDGMAMAASCLVRGFPNWTPVLVRRSGAVSLGRSEQS